MQNKREAEEMVQQVTSFPLKQKDMSVYLRVYIKIPVWIFKPVTSEVGSQRKVYLCG